MDAESVKMEISEDQRDLLPTSDFKTNFEAPCPQCDRIFYSERSLRCHLKIHNEKTLKCSSCPLMFNRLDTLFYHVSEHYIAQLNRIECHVEGCGKIVSSMFEGEQHACEKHMIDNQMYLKCKTCGKVSQTFRKMFSHHALKHGDLKQYVDDTTFKQKQYLAKKKNEMKKISSTIQAKHSPTLFSNLSDLLLAHEDEKSVEPEPVETTSPSETDQFQRLNFDVMKTDEIEESFDMKNMTQQEKEMITKLKIAITPTNGESNSEMLEKLSNFVSSVFPNDDESFYQCPHCGLGFIDSVLWMTHLSYHDNTDPFKCSFCSRKFENRQSFVIHLTYFAHGGKDE